MKDTIVNLAILREPQVGRGWVATGGRWDDRDFGVAIFSCTAKRADALIALADPESFIPQ